MSPWVVYPGILLFTTTLSRYYFNLPLCVLQISGTHNLDRVPAVPVVQSAPVRAAIHGTN